MRAALRALTCCLCAGQQLQQRLLTVPDLCAKPVQRHCAHPTAARSACSGFPASCTANPARQCVLMLQGAEQLLLTRNILSCTCWQTLESAARLELRLTVERMLQLQRQRRAQGRPARRAWRPQGRPAPMCSQLRTAREHISLCPLLPPTHAIDACKLPRLLGSQCMSSCVAVQACRA